MENVDSGELTGITEAITDGPIKPIKDKRFIINNILQPWLKQCKKTLISKTLLSGDNPLVQSMVKKFELPNAEKYPFQSQDTSLKGLWTIVGHVISPEQEKDVKKMGGILGIGGGADTFWDTEILPFHLNNKNYIDAGAIMLVFITPAFLVKNNEPNLPLSLFNLSIKAKDLPETYLSSAKRNFTGTDESILNNILNNTKVLPLDWCIAEINV